MATYTVKLDDDVRVVLERSTITESSLTLPDQLDRDLYERVNKVLSAAGGKWNRPAKAHLFPRDPRAALGLALATGGIANEAKALQQYFTPPWLATVACDEAGIDGGMTVLEPSAGAGALALEAFRRGAKVHCIELDLKLATDLRVAGYCTVQQADFLGLQVRETWDRVVMNPPFAEGRDVAHVLHAVRFVKPGGRLVAIMPAGILSGARRDQVRVRDLAAGQIRLLPEKSFTDAGTDVRTVLVTIDP